MAKPKSPNPYSDMFLQAMKHNQHPLTADFNGEQQEGGSLFQVTQKNGRRHSAAVAYLKPAQSSKNLEIITNAHISRVLISDKKATGVEAPPLGAKSVEDVFGAALDNDQAIEQELRNRSDSVYHPVGSCKMGWRTAPWLILNCRYGGFEICALLTPLSCRP